MIYGEKFLPINEGIIDKLKQGSIISKHVKEYDQYNKKFISKYNYASENVQKTDVILNHIVDIKNKESYIKRADQNLSIASKEIEEALNLTIDFQKKHKDFVEKERLNEKEFVAIFDSKNPYPPVDENTIMGKKQSYYKDIIRTNLKWCKELKDTINHDNKILNKYR